METIRLYDYPASGNCYKVRLLLAQLDRPYERTEIDIFAGDTLTESYRQINPHRQVPALELESGEVLIESAAILVYLAQGTDLLPDGPLALARAMRWLMFEQTDVVGPIGGLRFRMETDRLDPADPDGAARRRAGEEILAVLDDHLAERSFFLGDRYSIVDIAMYSYLHAAEEAGYDLALHPPLAAWLERVTETPRFVNDLKPYPPNARRGVGSSIYG